MRFSQIILAAASASFAAAEYIRCGTPNVNATQMAAMDAVVQASDQRVMAAAAVSVGVYVHVVTTTAKQGRYTQAMVNEQIAVMVSFKLSAVFVLMLTAPLERCVQLHGNLVQAPGH